MKRRKFLAGVAAFVLTMPAPAKPQSGKPVSLGWLSFGVPERGPENWRPGFENYLREAGWDPRLERRYARGDLEALHAYAAEFAHGAKVAVIVATDTTAAQAAKRATASVPIVICGLADPVGAGLVASLSRPDGNVTGVTSGYDRGITSKWVELLLAIRPMRSIAVIWSPDSGTAHERLNEIERVAANGGVAVKRLGIRKEADADVAVNVLAAGGIDGMIFDADLPLLRYAPQVLGTARDRGIPAIAPFIPLAQHGALLAFGPSLPEIYRLAAVYTDRILRGAKPRDLPIEQIAKYDLLVNMRTARALNVTIPQSLLLRADQVLE